MTKKEFLAGIKDGIPIGLGYFAVAFSLGIFAKSAGLSPLQGLVASFLNHASAGEYALSSAIHSKATYIEIAIATLVINARYFLMSCALGQRFDPKAPFIHRLLVGFGITDEIFGIAIARGKTVSPFYNYGAFFIAVPLWSTGTALGIIAGSILPANIVSALSVALYGMFIAIIIPPCRKNFALAACVISSFAMSYAFSVLPHIKDLSGGTRTIILTVVISSIVAFIKPIPEEDKEEDK